jgi:hypothetical protein
MTTSSLIERGLTGTGCERSVAITLQYRAARLRRTRREGIPAHGDRTRPAVRPVIAAAADDARQAVKVHVIEPGARHVGRLLGRDGTRRVVLDAVAAVPERAVRVAII